MVDIEDITRRTRDNCHISDARYAGNYTMCIFLLKMREYYRWEQRLPFDVQLPREQLGDWLVQREALWNEVEENDYHSLPLPEPVDPLDSTTVNARLIPEGYIYSSGFGVFGKPHFFLGQLQRNEIVEGNTLYVVGDELARDLVAPPAMSQGNTIFIRRESVKRFMWERIEQWQWSGRKERAMTYAVSLYGDDNDLDKLLDVMTDNEINTMILHEIGEARVGRELGEAQQHWQDMVSTFASSRTEFLLRATRDIIADCNVTLPTLLDESNDAALHFYFANYSGMRKHLFPEMLDAYHQFLDHRSKQPLLELARVGAEQWQRKLDETVQNWTRSGSLEAEQISRILEAA